MGVQWLRLHPSDAGSEGATPGWGAKMPRALQPINIKKKKKENEIKQVKPSTASTTIKVSYE